MVAGGRRGLGPAFGNLFTSNLASSLGDGIARRAAPLLAVRLTDDPLLVSGIAALAMLPWLLFAVPAGIIVDRIDRRTGSMPLGSLIGGALGRIDLTVPLIVGGGAATLAAIVFFRFLTTLPNPEDVDNGDPR